MIESGQYAQLLKTKTETVAVNTKKKTVAFKMKTKNKTDV